MYNKLFTSILDSSIWLEATSTRIVWVTFLAAMDEDGFVRMATAINLAARARVTLEEANAAIFALESPDKLCPDQESQGRRIELVDGGWMVVNAKKYRDIVNRENEKEQTRLRVARHRAKRKADEASNGAVTVDTVLSGKVTPSEAEATTSTDQNSEGVCTDRSRAREAQVAPASPTPALVGNGESAMTNKPTPEQALAHHGEHWAACEAAYTVEEMRDAYRQMEAGADLQGWWMWGNRRAGDWRAALEQRMADNRARKDCPSPSVQGILDSQELPRVEKAIANILNQYEAHQSLGGHDREQLKKLRERRTELKARLGFHA